VMGALCFPALAVVLIAGAIVILASRYVSLASLTVATLMPVTLYAFTIGTGGNPWWPIFGLVAAVIIWVAHLGNIKRLIEGTERRITWPPKVLQPLLNNNRHRTG
jgi:acyl phosphate:glycerol-3-phosphate acyltransferase